VFSLFLQKERFKYKETLKTLKEHKFEEAINISIIPDQLKNQRFIILNPSNDPKMGKVPYEKGWTKDKNYSKEEIDSKQINKTTSVQKYGILCGYNKLVVIDCDSEDFQNKCNKHEIFKKTFTVKTAAKELNHYYFYVDDEAPITQRLDKFTDSGKQRVADIQGRGTQVVGPNSKIGEKSYQIVNEAEIQKISYIDLIALCRGMLPNIQIVDTYKKKRIEQNIDDDLDFELDPVLAYIKSKITIRDLLEEIGINTRMGRNCECPFHTSVNGQCFSYDDHQYHCFHCNRGGSMFDFIMEYNNCNFIEAKEILANKVGVPEQIIKEAEKLIIRAKKAEATEYIVQQFMKDNQVYTIKNDLKSEMWIYNDGIYVPNAKSFIKTFCRAMLGNYYTTHITNQVICKIEADTFIDEDKFFLHKPKDLIAVRNGILNVITNEIIKFDSSKIFFNKFPVFYNPDKKDCNKIMEFIKSTLANLEDIDTLQELIGYMFSDECKYKKGFMFVGRGDNGKSVMIDLFNELIGKENISNVSLQNLDEDQFSASNLFGKVANINADIGKGKLNETGMLKNLIAGDTIYANRKFLNPIKFKNRAKMIFAANTLPETEDESDGFFTRWIIIEFPYSFKRQTEFDELTPEELATGKFKLADQYILEKITNEEELTGLLNWALEGLHRLMKNKDFTKSSSVEKIKSFWIRKSSSMVAFIMDRLEFTYDDNDYVFAHDMRFEYIAYCKGHKIKPQMSKECTKIFDNYATKYMNKKIATGSGSFDYKKVWTGVKFKGEEQ